MSPSRLAPLLLLLVAAGTARADTITVAPAAPSATVGNSIVITLADDAGDDGIADGAFEASTGGLSLNWTLINSTGASVSGSGSSITNAGVPFNNNTTTFLIISSTATTSAEVITFTAAGETFTPATVNVTFTAGALDHFDMKVTGTTAPNVRATSSISCEAEDRFNNVITTYAGSPTVTLRQNDLTTAATGTPSPASVTFAAGVATLNVSDDYAEGPIAVRLTDGSVSSFADLRITWQQQPVQAYTLSSTAFTAGQAVATLSVTSLQLNSGLATNDQVMLTLPGDWALGSAAANDPDDAATAWSTGVIDAAARTVTWTRTGAYVAGNTTLGVTFSVTSSQATTSTVAQSIAVRTTRDAALTTALTVSPFGAQGIYAPPAPFGPPQTPPTLPFPANASTRVSLQVALDGDSLRQIFDTDQTGVTYSFSFRTRTSIPPSGTLILDVDPDDRAGEFDISAAQFLGWSGVNGGVSMTVDVPQSKLYLVRDGTGSTIPAGVTHRVTIGGVTNPSQSGSPIHGGGEWPIELQTTDLPFTGSQTVTNLDRAGTNRPTVDIRSRSPDSIGLAVSGSSPLSALPKGQTVTFTISDLDKIAIDSGEQIRFVFPPFLPEWNTLAGGFVVQSGENHNDFNAVGPTISAVFGSNTANQIAYTSENNARTLSNSHDVTVKLPDYPVQGARILIYHNSTDTNGNGRDHHFALTPPFNVVDTGNLVVTADPARATNGTARISSAPTNTKALYDVVFTHGNAIKQDGFVDVITLPGDSFYAVPTGPTSGVVIRNLVLEGLRFGAAYGAGDTPNTAADGSIFVRYVRNASPANDAVEVYDQSGGTLLATGTVGNSNGLGYLILNQNGGSGVSGSVVLAQRGSATEGMTVSPPVLNIPAQFKAHSLRGENGRPVFRFKNTSGGGIAGGGGTQRTFVIENSATPNAITLATLPSSTGVTVRTIESNGTTLTEGPTTVAFSSTGQVLEGPAASSAPRVTLNQTRTYENVTSVTLEVGTRSQIPPGGQLVLEVPAEFVVTQGTLAGTWLTNPRTSNAGPAFTDPTLTTPIGSAQTATYTGVGQTLVVVNDGALPIAAGYHTVTFTDPTAVVRNPALPGSYVPRVSTTNATGALLDGTAGGPTNCGAVVANGHVAGSDPIVATVNVTPLGTGDTATCTVNFTTKSDIPVAAGGGVLLVRFFDADGSLDLSGTTAATWTPTGNPTDVVGNLSVSGSVAGTANPVLTIARLAAGGGTQLRRGAMQVSFTIKNPRRALTSYAIQVETAQTSGLIDQSNGTTPTFTTQGGAVTNAVLVSPASVTAGTTGATYTMTFQTQSFLPPNGFIEVSLPPGTGFDLPAATTIVATVPNFVVGGAGSLGATPTLTLTPNAPPLASILRIRNDSGSTLLNGSYQLQVTNLRNSTRPGAYAVSVRTLAPDGATPIDASATTPQTVAVQGGTFTVTSSPASVTAGASSDSYVFEFQLNADVVAGNAIELGFPLGYTTIRSPSPPPLTAATLQTSADGVTYGNAASTVSALNDNVTLRVLPTATIDASTTRYVRVTVTNVRNTTVVAPHAFTSLRTINTGNGTTIDAAAALPSVTVDGAGFPLPTANSVTYGVAPTAANQATSSHTMTFQMGSTLPRDGLVAIVFEDPEVKLATSLTTASTFTGGAGDAITWAGIDGGYKVRAIRHATSAGVTRTGLVLERDMALGANGDTSPVRHAIQLVNVVTNTSLKGATQYRIATFRNPAVATRPRVRAGGSASLTLNATTPVTLLDAGDIFVDTDLTGAVYLVADASGGMFTVSAYKDATSRHASALLGTSVPVAAGTANVTVSCNGFNVHVDVGAGVAAGDSVAVETLWRIDPPASGNDLSGSATIVESPAQNVNDVVSPPAKGAASTHTITFTTPVIVRQNHVVRIHLTDQAGTRAPFSLSTTATAGAPPPNVTWTVNDGAVTNVTAFTVATDPAPDTAVLWVTYTGAADLPAGVHTLTLQQVLNSNDEASDFLARVSLYRQVTAGAPSTLQAADRVITESSSPNFSLSGAQLTDVTATPSNTKANQASGYTISFKSLTQIPSTGQVRIVFPKDALDMVRNFGLATLDAQNLTGAVGSWMYDSDNNGTVDTSLATPLIRVDAANGVLVISRKDGGPIIGNGTTPVLHQLVLANNAPTTSVQNVDTKGTYRLAISTHSYGSDTLAGAIIEGPNDSSTFNLVGDAVNVTGVTLTPATSGAASAHTITFTTSTRLPRDAKVVLTYDGGADNWTNVTPSVGADPNGLNPVNLVFSAGVLTFDRSLAPSATLAPGTYSITINGFTNSTNRHREHRVTVETRDSASVPIDITPAGAVGFPPRFVVTPGALSAVTVAPSPTTASNNNATHAIDFTTTSAIPRDGRIVVRYSDVDPTGGRFFDLSNVATADVTLSGVANPAGTTVELNNVPGRIVIKLDSGVIAQDLAAATRTLTLKKVINTSDAGLAKTLSLVTVSGAAPVADSHTVAGPTLAGGVVSLPLVGGLPPVVVPGTLSTTPPIADAIVDEIAGTVTFPSGAAAGLQINYSRYERVVATTTPPDSAVVIDQAATSAAFQITGGPATQIAFSGIGVGTPVNNRADWPGTFVLQLLDAAGNATTNTGGLPLDVSFNAPGETGAGAILTWRGGAASIPTSDIQPNGQVVLNHMRFQGRLTASTGTSDKGDIPLSVSIGGGAALTVTSGAGSNVVRVLPGDFARVSWPTAAAIAQQQVDVQWSAVTLTAHDLDGNRPPRTTTTPTVRILPRLSGTSTDADYETPKGSILGLTNDNEVPGAALDAGQGRVDIGANGARYIGPSGAIFLHVHDATTDAHLATIDATTFASVDPVQVTILTGEARRVLWNLPSAFGRRVSGSNPATTLAAGTYTFQLTLNGDTPAATATMTIGALSDGAAVAAALQTAIRAVTPSTVSPPNHILNAYRQARVVFTGGRYVVISGVDATTGTSAVGAITDTGPGPLYCMTALKLTDAQGASDQDGDPAAIYLVDAPFPSGTSFQLLDAGNNPTTQVGPEWIRVRVASTSNAGFDAPRLSYETATSLTLPKAMTGATPGIDYVDLLPPGTTTSLDGVLRYGGGNGDGAPLPLSVSIAREDTANSNRTLATIAGAGPVTITQSSPPGAAWTNGALAGKVVLFTSGPAFGRRALIATGNDATSFTTTGALAPAVLTLTGTVTLANGSATVSGSGTQFLTQLLPGDRVQFQADPTFYVVGAVTSNTSFDLTAPYPGANAAGLTTTRGGDPVAGDTFRIYTLTDLQVASSQVDGVNNTIVFTAAKASRFNLQFPQTTFRVNQNNPGTIQARDRYGNRTNNVGGGAVFSLQASPAPVGPPFSATNLLTDLPAGGGTTVLSQSFANGAAQINPKYLGAARADGTDQITLRITVDGVDATINGNNPVNVEASTPTYVQWVNINNATVRADRPLNDAAPPTGLRVGPAGGPYVLRLFDFSGNAVDPNDVPTPDGVRVDVVTTGGFPMLDPLAEETAQTDAVSFGTNNILQRADFTNNAANLASMRFQGRASQTDGQQLQAVLLLTPAVNLTPYPGTQNPTITVKPGAFHHFHWDLANNQQEPGQPLAAGGTYRVIAHDAYHNRLGAAGEEYEVRQDTPISNFSITANAGTTPELVYFFPTNASDAGCRLGFGPTDPTSAAPLSGAVRVSKSGTGALAWNAGRLLLGPSPQADLRYFGLNGNVMVNARTGVATPGRVDQLTGQVTINDGSAVVIGTGTLFTTELRVGDLLEFASQAGTTYEVLSITNNTALTLATVYDPPGTPLNVLTTAAPTQPALVGVSNAFDVVGGARSDTLLIGAGEVDHLWFQDSPSAAWTATQTNDVAWNVTPADGRQIVARDRSNNTINNYSTAGKDVRLVAYEHRKAETATAYNGGTFALTLSTAPPAITVGTDNVIVVNRRTGAVGRVTNITGSTLTMASPGFQFGIGADNSARLVGDPLGADTFNLLVRLAPADSVFTIGDALNNTNSADVIPRTQFAFTGGTFNIDQTQGGAAKGLLWTGKIPAGVTIIVRPMVVNGVTLEHRGIRTGQGAPVVPTLGGLEVPVSPGTVTNFVWATTGAQQNDTAFTGANTLTAVDVSGNVNTAFNTATTLTLAIAPASRIPTSGSATVATGGTDTQFTTATPLTAAIVGRTVHLSTSGGAPKGDAVIVAFDSGTGVVTTTSVGATYTTGDLFVIDPIPAGATPLLTPNQLTNWASGVATLAGVVTYNGVANGVQVTITATANTVSATSAPITMNPGPGVKLAVTFLGTGLSRPDEMIVEGTPSLVAGGDPVIVQQFIPVVNPTQQFSTRVLVLDKNNNRVTSPAGTGATLLNSDPFGAQGSTPISWSIEGRADFAMLGRTVNNLASPPATRATPLSWTVTAGSDGGYAVTAGVASRAFRVQTDGVKRVEYLLDHPAVQNGTFTAANDSFTATTLRIVGQTFNANVVGMVLVHGHIGAFARITAAAGDTLTFSGGLRGTDPTRAGAVWQDGDTWQVRPMYHIDGMQGTTPGAAGVEGTTNTRVLTAGTAVTGRVLLLDSGNNITLGGGGDVVSVTTTDPFDTEPTANSAFSSGVFTFSLTPRQAAHNLAGVVPTTRDENEATLQKHSIAISAAVAGAPAVQGASDYQAVPGPANGVVLIFPPAQRLRRGDATTPVFGTPPLQTAGSAFIVRAYVVDQQNNPVDFDGPITLNVPFAGAATGPFTLTDGDTANTAAITITRSAFNQTITPNDPGALPGTLRPTTAFDIRPGAPSHVIVYTTTDGGSETLALGASAVGNPPASVSLTGALTDTAGVDNITVTATITDAFSNPALMFDFQAAGDRTARVTTTDPNNPAFDFNFGASTSSFMPTHDYGFTGFPAGSSMPLATLQRTITLTRAQLQHVLTLDLASIADDVTGTPTNHASRPIRVDPAAAARGVLVLPGQTLNPGARTALGQSAFSGTPTDQVEGVEFPILLFVTDAFFNVKFDDSTSTLQSLVNDEGTNYVGGLGFKLSTEGAATTVGGGQLEFSALNNFSFQLPFADASTGDTVAEQIQKAVRDQTAAVSEATTRFQARFLPEFARYLLISGQASKTAGPTSRVDMGGATTASLGLTGNGVQGVLTPNAATFSSGVLAFSMQHAVSAPIRSTTAQLNIAGVGNTNVTSESYRVLEPDFAIASVTLLDDGQGKIDRARVVFTLGAEAASIAGSAGQFELTQRMGSTVVATLQGASISLLTTVLSNDTIDVFFNGKLSTTAATGIELKYTRPQSGGLRADLSTGGKFLETVTRNDPRDGAVPALLNVTPQDADGNGGLDLLRFVFSEDVSFGAGAGFARSGFDAGDDTATAATNDGLIVSIDGEAAQPVTLGNQQSGAAVAAALQAAVRALTAANPFKQRAYDNFTVTYDARSGRYLLRSGVGLAASGGNYALDWGSSSVVVTPQGGNTGATNLRLGAAAGGFERAGFGDAQPGMTLSGAALPTSMQVVAGTSDQLMIELAGDSTRLFSLSITVDAVGTPSLDDRGRAIARRIQQVVRSIKTQAPSLQPAYDGFTATWDATADRLVLVSGITGAGSTVRIVPAGAKDAAPSLGLGAANGGTDVDGVDATLAQLRPLDDLIVLSQDGALNLLEGRTHADVTVVGARIDVRLSNPAATGTAMPRFAWIDGGDGGFVQDKAAAPRLLPESTNVSALSGRLAVVFDVDGTVDDILNVDAGDVQLDARNSLPPLTSAGGRVVYRWEQIGAPAGGGGDPANLVISNGDGSTPGTSTQDSSSPTARIVGATAPGDYTMRLVVTLVDTTGTPIPNAFTNGAAEVVREFRVRVANEAPVAMIAGANPRSTNGAVILDGTLSLDPNGGTLNYLWVAETSAGVAVTGAFSDPAVAMPTFTPTSAGVFKVTLHVATAPTPATTASPSASITIVNGLGAAVPYAEPGPSLTGRVRVPVVLDGALSVPLQGATYDWSIVSTPAPVQLSVTGAQARFTPSTPGLYTFQLTVSAAGGLTSVPREVTVMVVDDTASSPRYPPVARPRVVGLRRAAFLAQAPTSPLTTILMDDGRPLTIAHYVLTGQPAPIAAGLTKFDVVVGNAVSATAHVQLPNGRDLARVRLNDGTTAPVLAYAMNGDALTLDGTQSQSGSSVVADYSWRQLAGQFVFTTRKGGILGLSVVTGTYEFELTVSDSAGLTSRPARLRVPVLPTGTSAEGPPTAAASAPARVALGATANLDATASVSRASGAGLTYLWSQVAGPNCALFNATGATASAQPSAAGLHTFRVRVTDANGAWDEAEVSFAADPDSGQAPVVQLTGASDLAIAPGQVRVVANLSASATGSGGAGSYRYLWSQLDGSPVFVDNLTAGEQARLELRVPGRYAFAVRAVRIDAAGVPQATSAPATASFFVTGGEDVALANGGVRSESSGGCAIASPRSAPGAWPIAALALLLVALRLANRTIPGRGGN